MKHHTETNDVGKVKVAPHAGAWIETYYNKHADKINPVAPHAGAWIETP